MSYMQLLELVGLSLIVAVLVALMPALPSLLKRRAIEKSHSNSRSLEAQASISGTDYARNVSRATMSTSPTCASESSSVQQKDMLSPTSRARSLLTSKN